MNKDRCFCELRCDEGIRFFKNNVCGTLRAMNAGGDKCILEADKIIEINNREKEVHGMLRIRKLTPTECFKLMGFTESDCKKCSENGISNTQLYKQAGNSIVVNVLEEIFKSLGDNYLEFRSEG